MSPQWVVEHDLQLRERVADALNDGGVVLVGPVGAGKAELADTAAEDFAARHAQAAIRRVAASPSTRGVPFGAFAHLIDVAEAGHTSALLRAARESLSGPAEQVIVVNDAHQLDRLSATLLYHLAADHSARLIVTVDAVAPVPDAIEALWADGLLPRIDIESSVDDVEMRVSDHLAALPEAAQTVLRYLAVQDPLSEADLIALTSLDAVEQAAAAGAVRVEDHLVRPAHPLYTAAALAGLSADDGRRLRTALVERIGGADDVIGRLRLAALAVDSDAPQPVDDVVAAAAEALRLGDNEFGARLARSALERSESLAARLTLANALVWQGRGREADRVLEAVDPAGLSETDLMAWALPRAANQFWMLSEPTRAAAFLQTVRNRVSAPGARATLDALAATFATNAGTPLRALRLADEVLASPHADDVAVGWAASAAALSSARTGRFGPVDELAARALSAGHPGLLRFTSGFGRVTALLMAGRLDEARALAQRYTDFAELQEPGRAVGEVLVSYVAIAQGDFGTAVTLLGRAAEALAPTGYSWGPLSLMLLAQALGQQGDQIGAAKALSAAEARHGMKSALFTPELSLARAWSKAARKDMREAIDAAREAVQAAERGGQSAVALRALQDAARLGDTQAVYRAQRLAAETDCVLGRLTLAHAQAVTNGDGVALKEIAEELTDIGMHPAAADAARQAQHLHEGD